jgi:hypothetical protein
MNFLMIKKKFLNLLVKVEVILLIHLRLLTLPSEVLNLLKKKKLVQVMLKY